MQLTTVQLWVNGFDASIDQWNKYGSSPYLDAQDNINYVEDSDRNNNCGNFTFETTSETGEINSVKLYIYAWSVSPTDFEAYINEVATGLNPPITAGWVNIDIISIIGTWEAINSAMLVLDRSNTKNLAGCDAAYLLIDYTSGPTPGWNRLEYFSEPPTGGQWNKLAWASGTPVSGAWNKLKYGT